MLVTYTHTYLPNCLECHISGLSRGVWGLAGWARGLLGPEYGLGISRLTLTQSQQTPRRKLEV